MGRWSFGVPIFRISVRLLHLDRNRDHRVDLTEQDVAHQTASMRRTPGDEVGAYACEGGTDDAHRLAIEQRHNSLPDSIA